MGDLKGRVPRLKAWDAEEDDNGWCVDVKDLKNYLEELLAKVDEFRSENALGVIEDGIKDLIEHIRNDECREDS